MASSVRGLRGWDCRLRWLGTDHLPAIETLDELQDVRVLRKSIPENSNTQLSHNSSLLSSTIISRIKPVPEDRLCCCLGPEQTCPTDFGLNFILIGAFIPDEAYLTRKENWKRAWGPGGYQ